MIGNERRQMRANTDRPHARPATAVGNAESLVQVHVRHVGADVRRPRQPDLGIEIGAVHVHLPAVLVDNFADLADTLLIHAVSRWIGRHQARQLVPRRGSLGFQVVQIDVAGLVALDITTRIPAICAEAGLVPWAEDGIRQMSRAPCCRLS